MLKKRQSRSAKAICICMRDLLCRACVIELVRSVKVHLDQGVEQNIHMEKRQVFGCLHISFEVDSIIWVTPRKKKKRERERQNDWI